MNNYTVVTELVLLGLSDDPDFQIVTFLFLFITYVLSFTGNLTLTTLTSVNSHLQTPMYFFLHNVSFLEISFTTVCIPRCLGAVITRDKTISYNNCAAQLFFIFMRVTEFYILTAMSYDSFVAICKPLRYTCTTNRKLCSLLLSCVWDSHPLCFFPPPPDYCASKVIDHFACDYFPLLQLSCSNTWLLEVIGFYLALVTLLFTLALMILSYMCVIRTILRIPSSSKRKKTFSTCSSHMTVISTSYGSCIFMYANPCAKEKSLTKGVAIVNTSVAPVQNPFIYSLRNQEVKQVFKNFLQNIVLLQIG
uniref:G-protein coupled receptors family 1 profile domain-containing protein n=1 Tax=Loxodonta africana TaxID=9785 RepID=G3UBS9_LOXAF